jgi:dipeptidase
MCDTVCSRLADRTLFAKNSDRPVVEPQVVEGHRRRRPGGRVRTQYLDLHDAGAAALVGSRPDWLWGFEHGVNEHRVAIGNERVWTVDDPAAAPPALIGMDLVRLGLERGRTADEAVDVLTSLLTEHGQGGVADRAEGEAYFSSFLVADPHAAWVVETSGSTWAARPVTTGAAISNRISLGADWTRASDDVAPGVDFDRWRDPDAWAAIADVRLARTVPVVAGGEVRGPRDLVALLRDHDGDRWGAPGDDPTAVAPVPGPQLGPHAEGVTVCMHVRGYQATAAAMVCDLPADAAEPLRAWVALGAPCASVFVPVFPADAPAGTAGLGVPDALGHDASWRRFAALRDRVEADDGALVEVRSVLGPLETELWAEADDVAADPSARERFVAGTWSRVDVALATLGV